MKEVGASFEVFFIASSIFTYNYLSTKMFRLALVNNINVVDHYLHLLNI